MTIPSPTHRRRRVIRFKNGDSELVVAKMIVDAARLLSTGKARNICEVAEILKVNRPYLARIMHEGDNYVYLKRTILQEFSAAAPAAAARIVELSHCDNLKVAFEASRFILAMQKIAPPEKAGTAVNVNVSAGYVIDLRPATSQLPPPSLEAETIADAEVIDVDDGDLIASLG